MHVLRSRILHTTRVGLANRQQARMPGTRQGRGAAGVPGQRQPCPLPAIHQTRVIRHQRRPPFQVPRAALSARPRARLSVVAGAHAARERGTPAAWAGRCSLPAVDGSMPSHDEARTRTRRAVRSVCRAARTHARNSRRDTTIARAHAYNEPPLCCWPRHRQRDARWAHAREEGQADDAATRPLAHHQADWLISLRVRGTRALQPLLLW